MPEITTHDIWTMAKDAAESDIDAKEAAQKIVKSLRAAEIRSFAQDYVRQAIDGWRRIKARQVEEAAERAARRDEDLRRRVEDTKARSGDQIETLVTRYDPSKKWDADRNNVTFLNGRQRKAARRHLGDDFNNWLEIHRNRVHATGDRELIEFFESDWHPDGPQAYFAEKRAQSVMQLVKEVQEETRIHVTRELLETVFALGTGERVTWGAATIDQHRERVALLRTNILGNLETAARHEAAIQMIEQAGVKCLAQLAEAVGDAA